jgi:LysR family cys regulon transcriptional activator
MNFQQLRIVRETVRQNFNLTEVGKIVFTSQSGVSKSLKELEDELGIEIFERMGKRLVSLTPAGESLLEGINRILLDAHNLRVVASQFANKAKGNLILATTHAQARYALPQYLQTFKQDYPDVHLTIYESSPREISRLLIEGEADIGIATEGLHLIDELITFSWYDWHHNILAPLNHPILDLGETITLEELSEYPLITYHAGLAGRSGVDAAFEKAGLSPDFVLTALDADVIKTYVEHGLGLGIAGSFSYNPERGSQLKSISAAHLFNMNTTRIALKRGHHLRDFAYDFIERISPKLTREDVIAQLVLPN